MKKISRRSFLAVCGAMAATAALTACGGSSASTAGTAASGSTAGSAASGEVFELKLSTTQTDTSMIYQGLQAAADKVAEDTDGHVKVTIYPSSQLGGEEDMIDQALQGMTIVEVDKDVFREAVKPAYEKLGWTELREQLYKEAGVEA